MQSPKNELRVYSEDAPPPPWEIEHLIVKIVLFFMQPKNWSFTNIENILIPGILQHSHAFKGGKELNLTHFGNINLSHMYSLSYVFPRLEKVILRTGPKDILECLLPFEKLIELDIQLETNCRFNPTHIRLPIKIITIHAEDHAFCIQELIQCVPKIEQFTLTGGQLTIFTIALLEQLPLDTINLINVQLDDKMIETTLNLLLKPTIKKLKVVLTKENMYNLNFKLFLNFLLSRVGPNSNIEDLTFTLNQESEASQNLLNLWSTAQLKKVTIYFTSQESISKLFELINILLSKPGLDITFVEYYDYTKHNLNTEYVGVVTERSKHALTILNAAELSAKIIMINHSVHFPSNS